MAALLPSRIQGTALRTLAKFVRTKAGAALAHQILRNDLGVHRLAKLDGSLRGPIPVDNRAVIARSNHTWGDQDLNDPAASAAAWPRTAAYFEQQYLNGSLSPETVARRALESARDLASRTPAMSPLFTYDDVGSAHAAKASLERYKHKKHIGPLDGVCVVVKEELDYRGFPVQVGSRSKPPIPSLFDATVVRRLRDAGAVLLGQSMMTEFGMSPLGGNAARKMPRNPHHTGHLPGGSSSGSGVAVATGLCPVAVAADGGGSIRIPACLNGVFGFKPTWGRISRNGDAFEGTMNHVGPIGASVRDLAIFFDAVAGFDELDPCTHGTPEVAPQQFTKAMRRGVKGARIAVLESEWADASYPVAAAGSEALRALEKEGATLVPAQLELAQYAASIGYLVIGVEELAGTRDERMYHWDALGPEYQVAMAALGATEAELFLDALRLRVGLRQQVATLLNDVDLIALPTTATAAPATDAEAIEGGFIDAKALDAMCRFAFLANLTGLPSGTAPVGVDPSGLPVGMQLMGDAFDEPSIFAALAHLERIGAAKVKQPTVFVESLS